MYDYVICEESLVTGFIAGGNLNFLVIDHGIIVLLIFVHVTRHNVITIVSQNNHRAP